MAHNNKMLNAKANVNDEFYTQYSTISKELEYYVNQFKDQVVYCNCDNPEFSNFYLYFKDNFHKLGLKKLITSHINFEGTSYSISYDGVNETKIELEGNGDFRSPECIELLKQSDIVVTNPPFSLFREFISTLIKHNKKFLVIGNFITIICRELFPLIKDNKMCLGCSPRNIEFITDSGIKSVNACWFTNLEHSKRNTWFNAKETWNIDDYKEYVNFNAIDVSKAKDIPMGYKGVMGVPLTFLEKLNPEQFEILGTNRHAEHLKKDIKYINLRDEQVKSKTTLGDNCYILSNTPTKRYFTCDNFAGYIIELYARLFIKFRE